LGYCISPTASPLVGSASAKEPYWANFHTPGTAAYCQVVPDITGGDGGPGFAASYDPADLGAQKRSFAQMRQHS